MFLCCLVPQGNGHGAPRPPAPAAQDPPAPRLGVDYDERGWPRMPEPVPRPELEARVPVERTPPPATPAAAPAVETAAPAKATALARVFQAVQPPAVFAALGGVTVWWRLTVFGVQGEPIGSREITQVADLAAGDRDRLEFGDGLVCGRLGSAVFAERQGMPWPTMVETATHQLRLFGLLLRLPWAFADVRQFDELGADQTQRGGETFLRLRLQRRAGDRPFGPAPEPVATDRFELWCDPQSGLPRELAYTLASSGQERRAQLADWRPVNGVQLPFRRVFVDELGRATTVLEILRIETAMAVADRDFRLH